jgi:hypothetical protein
MPVVALGLAVAALLPGAALPAPGSGGRTVTIVVDGGPRAVTLEWRSVEPAGTRLVAARDLVLQGRVPVIVPDGESVLRVRETGAAPHSLFVPAQAADVVFEVGARGAGGELLGRVAPHRFTPASFRLSGPAGGILRPDGDRVIHGRALPAGAYLLTPVYRGAFEGTPLRVAVADGQTTEPWPLDLPEAGAVRVELDGASCGEAGLALRLEPLAEPARAQVLAAPPDACSMEVEGLAPGEWRAALTAGGTRNEPRGSVAFAVAAGETTDVRLEGDVRVVGTVTAGGLPAVGLRVQFDLAAQRWSVATDESGAFAARLGRAGEYTIAVGGGDLPSRTFRRTYASGEQREDVELAMGAIAVVVRAEGAAAEPVDLGLFATDGRRRAGRVQLPGGHGAFAGLDLGTYTVTASTASGLRSREPAHAELTAASPTASVELVLERGGGTLKVVDASGSPLAGASATVAGRSLAERAPGVFGLDAVPAGERVIAQAPGHVAACRVLDGSRREMTVSLLLPSDVLELSLRPDAPWRDALLVGLPGSDCPVSIDDVEPQVRAEEHGVTVALRLPRGSFSLALGGQAHPVSAPGTVEIP